MRCQYCNQEIPEDAVFCPECGQKQGISVCPECGEPVEEGAAFCAECGAKIETGTPEIAEDIVEEIVEWPPIIHEEELGGQSGEPEKPAKKERSMVAIVILAAVILAVAALAIRFLVLNKDTDSQSGEEGITMDFADGGEEAAEANVEDADYNLLENDELMLEGLVKSAGDDRKVLQWENELTFYGINDKNEKILLENADTVMIDDADLPEGVFDGLSANASVTIDGRLYFMDEALYIEPYEIYADGIELIEEAKKNVESKSEYVLPQSSSKLLTGSDVDGLSLREINYAKNEIYARHGRRFKSAELQNYFNSKSWYNGTIDPDSFSESILSDIEKKNASFLSDLEYSIDSRGYQLDAN
ncbi:MAG: YARHG domain-containing protein [Eubacteriales bacterium]|nr:YARHG domain-containing protein [Eubacteriales bacterium]